MKNTFKNEKNYYQNKSIKIAIFLGIFIALVIAFWLDLSLGSTRIPPFSILQILTGNTDVPPIWTEIVWDIRLPKAIVAIVVGMALATSGLQLQTLFQNPLAGPYVLGISSGASVGVAIATLVSGGLWRGSIDTTLAAWLGAMAVTNLTLFTAKYLRQPTILLILGLLYGYGANAIVSLLLYLTTPERAQSFIGWTLGSFGGVSWQQLPLIVGGVFLGLSVAYASTPRLNLWLLGSESVRALGANPQHLQLAVLISTSLLAGVTTAFCGPIAFIGVAVPHLARSLLFSPDLRTLMPATALLGGLLALAADMCTGWGKVLLPINTITSAIGVPIVAMVIWRQQMKKYRH
jgi:iron complex transport system permease protein